MVRQFQVRKDRKIFMVFLLVFSILAGMTLPMTAGIENKSGDGATVAVGTVSGKPGEVVDVPVSIENNPGIVAFYINISYDASKLKLIGVTNGSVLNDPSHSGSYRENPYRLCFDMGLSTVNNTNNGVVATLSFEILASAEVGNTPVTCTYNPNEIYDIDYQNVPFNIINGNIEVENTGIPTVTVGENEGSPGSTGIEIPITIENNPGIVAFYVSIGYDASKIKLTGVTNGTVLTDPAHSGSLATNPYRLCFDMGLSSSNITANGVVATLTFEVLEGVQPGDVTISVDYDTDEIYDVKMNNVFFEKVNGKITVSEEKFPPSFTTHPTGQTVKVGQDVTFTAEAVNEPNYRWQVNNGFGWSDIAGVTSSGYTVTGATYAQNGNQYRCVATNSQGTAYSDVATLTVRKLDQALFVINDPGVKTYGNPAFQLSTSGGSAGTVNYTYVSGPGAVTGDGVVTITGAGTIVVKATKAGDETYNPITSENRSITVNPASLILTADNKNIMVGGGEPAYTYTVSGLVSPDTAAVVTTPPTMSVDGFNSAVPGSFTITLAGGETSNENYRIDSRLNGTLTVSAKIDVSGSIVFHPGSAIYTGSELDCSAASGLSGGTWTYTYTPVSETASLGSNHKPLSAGVYSVTVKFEDATRLGSKTETFTVGKADGSTVSAPETVGTPTENSISVSSASPVNGQSVEYAKNTVNTVPETGWQDSGIFNGLSADTEYFFFARAKENSNYFAGTESAGTVIRTAAKNPENTPTVTVGSVSGKQGETVSIPVSISNNSGIVSFNVSISYDSTKLKLVGVTNGSVLTDPGHSGSLDTNPYRLSFDMGLSPENITANGVIAVLSFEILAATGDIAVNVDYNPNEIFDIDYHNVYFDKVNGKVTVQEIKDEPFFMSFCNDEVKIWADAGIIPSGAIFRVVKITPPPSSVEDKVNDQLGSSVSVLGYYEITLEDGDGNFITQLPGEITIATKILSENESGKKICMYQEDETGKLVKMETWVEDGYIFYKTSWLEQYDR